MRFALLFVAVLPLAAFACSSFGDGTPEPVSPGAEAGAPDAPAPSDAGAPDADAAQVSSLALGLLARWRFDEAGGTVAKNDVVTAPAGAVVNADWAAGKLGGALMFNLAAKSHVTVAPSPTLDVTTAFTISLWCNLGLSDPVDDARFVHRGPIDFKLNNRSPQIRVGAGALAVTSYDLPQNEWHHIVTTYDAGAALIYIDGIVSSLREITFSAEPIRAQTEALYIGSYGDTAGIANGLLDDVRLWNRALTSVEVTELFNEK